MKLSLKFVALFLWIAQISYAQNSNAVLTKIERTVNVGKMTDYFDASLAPFYHGVASGDPLEDAVIIWTRVTTNVSSVNVQWKVATDPQMTQIVKQGNVVTDASRDYTVKLDITGLRAYQTYYYQFESQGRKSLVGKTKTTPSQTDLIDNLRFAVVSCSNYQNGYFNAYNQIGTRNDLDAVIHLGDYIYEYESGGYGYSNEIGRGHLPANEIITLDDYRVRYSYYRLDPMLRKAHQQHPFINIWDDHEFANDANKYGAENHTTATEGSWETRKANAHKAYFEWMPIRANTIEQYRLYRTISYGKLMDLIMLDTRIEGRDSQVSSSKNLISAAGSNEDFKRFAQEIIVSKDLSNEKDVREILEVVLPMLLKVNDQKSEIATGLSQKEFDIVVDEFATFILNKELTIAKKETVRLEKLLEKGAIYDDDFNERNNANTYKSILGGEQFTWLTDQLKQSQAKWRIIGNQVMVMPWKGVPSNDAWDGYNEERNRLLKYIKDNDINNLIVLTGDIHSTFVGEINYEEDCEMCEFVVPSITSQNLDFLGGFSAGVAEFYIKLMNRHIKDVDMDNHGYFVLDVREDKVQADWFDTNDVKRPILGESLSRSWYVNANDCKVRKASSATVALTSKNNTDEIVLNTEIINNTVKDDFVIIGVYPNPLEVEGNIHYLVNETAEIKINLFTTQGVKVQELQNTTVPKGIYNLSFNAATLSRGSYIIVIESGKTKASRTIVIK